MGVGLSAAQTEIWLAQQLEPQSAKYNLCEYMEIRGPVDTGLFEHAVRSAVAEVESLTVRFTERPDGTLRQEPDPARAWPFRVIDLSTATDPVGSALRWMRDTTDTPTPLDGPLLLGALLRLSAKRFFWYQRYHHITIDGFGIALVARRVAHLYTSAVRGEVPEAPSFGSLEQVLAEDRAYRASAGHAADASYWRDRLSDWSGPSLPAASSAPASSACHRVESRLPEEAAAALARLGGELRTSVPRLLTAAAALYVRHTTDSPDVTLGFVMGGRDSDQTAPVTMANILPLRLHIAATDSVADVVAAVAREIREAKRHQRYRYEDIRRSCFPAGRASSFGPLVNNYRFDYDFDFAGHRAVGTNLATGPIEDISFSFHDRSDGNGINVVVEANPLLHTEARTQEHLTRLLHVLGLVTSGSPDTPVRDVKLLTEAEEQHILTELSRCPDSAPLRTRCLHELFEEQVAERPDAPALVCRGTTWSYRTLDARANRLAAYMARQGVGRGDIVAVAMDRSHHLVAALLAVWKVGATQLPIDPTHPRDRIALLFDDAEPVLLLTSQTVDHTLDWFTDAPRLAVDAPASQDLLAAYSSAKVVRADDPQAVAYIIYTSGSTGRPKGVAVAHHPVHTYLRFALDTYTGLAQASMVHSPVSFDLTVTALYGPLIAGGSVTLVDAFEEGAHVPFVKATPAYVPLLDALDVRQSSDGGLALGGELLLWQSLAGRRRTNPHTTIFNEYGPTETTVGCSYLRIGPEDALLSGPVPIGRPIPGTLMYVLDSLRRLVPPGQTGELYIAGDCLAQGYLNDPHRTAERFLPDPFGPEGTRMYRTGDLARWRADGVLEFMGRTDSQVKVRGHRIELGEIEAVLAGHPSVGTAVAVAEPIGDIDHRLVCYVTPEPGRPAPDLTELASWASARLPEYMVPQTFMVLAEIPLTGNGKADRDLLPSHRERLAGAGPKAPVTSGAVILGGLFAEILGLEQMDPHDDFFDWGGSSLTGAQLVSRVRAVMGSGFTLADLLRLRTPAALAECLTPQRKLPELVPRKSARGHIPLSYAQQRLWYLAKLHGSTDAYHIRSGHRLRGPLDEAALAAAVADVVERHEVLRTVIRTAAGRPAALVLPAGHGPSLVVSQTSGARLDEDIAALVRKPFALDKDLPIRAELLVLGPDEHVLLLTLHHGVADAWSLAPLHRDLGRAYAARVRGTAPQWSPLPVQYADYAAWQRTALADSAALAEQERYWTKMLADAPTLSGPPTDRTRPPVAGHRGGVVPFALTADAHTRLAAFSRTSGVTLFMALHTGLLLALKHVGAPDDIVIGSPVAGRSDEMLKDLVGCFLNTLPLRTDLSGDPTVAELAGRVRNVDLAGLAAQDVPFDRVVELVKPTRDLAHHPVFQILLSFNNTASAALRIDGLDVDTVAVESPGAKFDLTLDVTERRTSDGRPAGLAGTLEYATDLFDRSSAVRMASLLERACDALAAAGPGDRATGLLADAPGSGSRLPGARRGGGR
ncbi:amino acid adenylation domain-containing protein [Streptomyces sp. BE230]|uniref:amino acid adenylation domain-containing protein n=1 Tax=Streptomyces sp. BE230 TaxID=3002526 RepID=UPI002ED377A1|nr:amino acid adenylation domain-containing protein [Streptomyces sp. BE230]